MLGMANILSNPESVKVDFLRGRPGRLFRQLRQAGGEGFDGGVLGVVEADGRERDVALAQGFEVGALHVAQLVQFAGHPIVGIAPRILAAFVLFDETRGTHARDAQAGELLVGQIGDIHVPEDVGRDAQPAGDHLLDERAADARRGVPVGFAERVERKRHGRNAHDGAFRGGGNGAGIEHADAGVGAEIDAAQDEIGLGLEQETDRQLDAIRRRAADGGAEMRAAGGPGARVQRLGQRDPVADGGAFAVGRDDVDVAQVLDRVVEGVDAGRLDAVVVAQENAHSPWMMAERRRDGKRGVAAADGTTPMRLLADQALESDFSTVWKNVFHTMENPRAAPNRMGAEAGRGQETLRTA